MSIAERIAALQNQGTDAPQPLTKPKANKSNALADRIAALQKNVESTSSGPSRGGSKADPPKVGKLKPPIGAVPITSFGARPPPSLLKKQKEREERMAKLKEEARSSTTGEGPETENPKVGKLKLSAGAVPIVPFGAGPPPSLLKKQKEREERMEKLQEEAKSKHGVGAPKSTVVDAEDALLSRPTINRKRRPRART
ncbi:hypothetical protein ACHAWF_001300 [Thalassiosira exigua]